MDSKQYLSVGQSCVCNAVKTLNVDFHHATPPTFFNIFSKKLIHFLIDFEE